MRTFVALAFLCACGGQIDPGTADGGGAGKDAASKHDVVTVPDVVDAGPAPIGGVNVSGGGLGYQAEDQIAVAPDGTIAILWTEILPTPPYVTMGYRFSTDDGQSFTPTQHITVPATLFPGDPTITVDADGNFYAGLLAIHYSSQTADYSQVYVARADKGSLSFGTPVEVSEPGNTTMLFDHPKIFVTSKGRILVGYASFAGMQAATAVGVVASSPDGVAWSRTEVVGQPEAAFANLFWFCEGQSSVYTTFLEATNADYFVGLRASADDGVTWSPSSTSVSLPGEPLAGLDPGCVASGDDVWVMYTTTKKPSIDESTLDMADAIRVAHSPNAGASFDAKRGEALDTAQSELAMIPILARESSGRLDVAYVAGDAAGDPNGSVRYDTMAGVVATPSVLVDAPLVFDTSRTAQTWVGDYFGAVVHGGALYLAYPRNDEGASHIWFAKASLP